MSNKSIRRVIGFGAAAVFVIAACGDTDESSSATDSPPAGSEIEAESDGAESTEPESDGEESAASGPERSDAAGSAPTGEVVVGYVDTVDTLNPFPQGSGSNQFRLNVYDPLLAVDDAGNPVARLAESWDFSEDGMALTLTLREGVTFHDGTPFDADVVVENIELWKDPATNVQGAQIWALVTASATDASTVELAFERPLPEIFGVMNTALVTKPGELDSGIGTGAFVLESFAPREGFVLTANPDYWDPERPAVATITAREFSDPAAAALSAQSGDLDVLLGVQANQVTDLEGAGLTVTQRSQGSNFDILINAESVPDPRVRRALNLAFDRERFVDTVLLGFATPQSSIYPPSSPVWASDAAPVAAWDLDGARQLLDEAGVDSLELTIMSPTVLPLDQFMPIYQADLASIGVELTIEPADAAAWATAVAQPGEIPDMAAHAYGFADLDPALIFSAHPFRVGANASAYVSDEYTRLVEEASAIVDVDERYEAFKAVDAFIAEESFMFPVANPTGLSATQPNVSGLNPTRAGIDYTAVAVTG